MTPDPRQFPASEERHALETQVREFLRRFESHSEAERKRFAQRVRERLAEIGKKPAASQVPA